jgi:hypothetical protein
MRQAQADRVIRSIPHTHRRRRKLVRNFKHAMLLLLMVGGTFLLLRYVFFIADYVPDYYEPKDMEREIERVKEGIEKGEIPMPVPVPTR